MKLVIAGSLLLSCAAAQSAIVVTQATVRHEFSGSAGWNMSSTVPLLNVSTGNQFNTWDGRAGASLDLGGEIGTLRLDAWSSSNAGLPPPYASMQQSQLLPSGEIRFTAIDGDFTLAGSLSPDSSFSRGVYRLTSLTTGRYREIVIAGLYAGASYINTGSLSWPAPPGNYVLTFSTSQGSFTQSTLPGSTWINFAITPEPALLGCVLPFMTARRRA